MSSLSSYLASKYLTATPSSSNKPTTKKRKRKTTTQPGLIIADDDISLSSQSHHPNNSDDDSPLLTSLGSSSAEFRKTKKSSWKTVSAKTGHDGDTDMNIDDEADRIIREAAAENSAAMNLDEAPVISDSVIKEEAGVVKMSDGTHAGLQRASDVAAQMERRKREEAAAWEAESGGKKGKRGGKGTKEEETVYRDATGRRIDISMRRHEAKKEMDEKLRKEKEEEEMQRGDVQLREREKRREDLEEAKYMGFARGVDDEGMNKELKERERWDDPALRFLVRGEGKHGAKGGGKKVYKGAAAPNRYGIRPGWRWDGVDRGNGWEGERFRGENRRTRNKELGFAWQMDE